LAGYRPIGLSSASSSTIIAGRATSYADRRRAAAERLSRDADLTHRIEAAVAVPAPDVVTTAPIDPDGVLRSAVRALVPIAHRTEGFDVRVSLGPEHRWAVHVRREGDGVSADLVPVALVAAAAGVEGGAGRSASEAEIAADIASLVWAGGAVSR
jgi:hypothetical protein